MTQPHTSDVLDMSSEATVINWLTQIILEEGSLVEGSFDAQTPFVEMGLDSLAAVTISGELETALDIEVPATLLWECQNIKELAQYVIKQTR